MEKLTKVSEQFRVFLAVAILGFGLFGAYGQADSNETRPVEVDLNKTEETSRSVGTPGTVLGIIKKILSYPLVKMGDSNLTLQSLFILGFLIVVVIFAEKIFRERIIMRIFEKTEFPEALEYGIARILGYVFMVIGFYMSLQIVGIDLSSLAFIAGGISVGVGFGMRDVINNFLSGIIIFAEQPIAIGDRVEVGDTAGRVIKISLRSTMVVTNDNITIIVPNGKFISESVTNWSYSDPKVRMKIPVSVAYGTDPEKLKELLLEVAKASSTTLEDPAPKVVFREFGDNSLKFELRVWTEEMSKRPGSYKSSLNFAIEEKLRENGIKIPFPQLDLHVQTDSIEIKNPKETKSSSE